MHEKEGASYSGRLIWKAIVDKTLNGVRISIIDFDV